MKTLFLSVSLLFLIDGYSQKQENDYKLLIDSALTLKVNEFIKVQKGDNAIDINQSNYYLIDENNFPYKYNRTFERIKFKSIDLSHPKNKQLLRKGIRVWKIIPTLKSNNLKVDIIEFMVTYRENTYKFLNGGGAEIEFEYSCESNKWVLIKFSNKGL